MSKNNFDDILERFINYFDYEMYAVRFDIFLSDNNQDSVYYIELDELYDDKIDILLFNPKAKEIARLDVDINIIESVDKKEYLTFALKTILNFIQLDIFELKFEANYFSEKYEGLKDV